MTEKDVISMAHVTEVVGTQSEMTARLALLSAGWITATTDTDEAFDIVARDPVNREWKTFQVKTIRKRMDRGGDLVVYARKKNGETYTQSDADYFIGVLGAEGDELPRVYMFENRGLTEYWATEARADKRWVSLPIALDREIYTDGETQCPAA